MPLDLSPTRKAFLAFVSPQLVHPGGGAADDCMVEVVARATGGSARDLVRCLYTRDAAHVHPSSVRPM